MVTRIPRHFSNHRAQWQGKGHAPAGVGHARPLFELRGGQPHFAVRLQDGLPAQSGAAKRPWPQIQWSVRDIGQRKGFIGPRRVTEDRIGQSPRDLNVSPTWCTDEVPGKHLRRRAWSAAPQRSEGNRRRDLQRRARGLVAHLPSQVGHRIRCPLEVGRNAPHPCPCRPRGDGVKGLAQIPVQHPWTPRDQPSWPLRFRKHRFIRPPTLCGCRG